MQVVIIHNLVLHRKEIMDRFNNTLPVKCGEQHF
jgi:hypothetical protein